MIGFKVGRGIVVIKFYCGVYYYSKYEEVKLEILYVWYVYSIEKVWCCFGV